MSGKNENRRYIGKVQQVNGANGLFQKILIDNPNPAKEDGTPNQYYKGSLLWCDAKTGKKFAVKQMSLKGVSQDMLQKDFVSSIAIDLDNEYHVKNLD